MKQFELLAEFCRKNGLEYDDNIDKQFETFCQMLVEKNKVMNLTAVTDHADIEIRHFIDSIEAVPIIQKIIEKNNTDKEISIIDMGTGAGFPGLPLKIMMPDAKITLADALNKRINFLYEVISALNLEKVEAVQGRAEELGQSERRETFDFCVSRAVADMSVLLEYCMPMIKIGGYAILYKSGDYKDEMMNAAFAMDILGGELENIIEFELPGSDLARSLIVIRKGKATPIKYPRRPGKPSKSPITNK